jgi:hypothetical protein
MFHVPEIYRLRTGVLASNGNDGNNGFFILPHYKISRYFINCMVSDGQAEEAEGWEHVSVTLSSPDRKVERCPTWEEMCFVKQTFWGPEDIVIQFHPAESEYVSNHNYCLHIWRNPNFEQKVPPSILVGIPTGQKI